MARLQLVVVALTLFCVQMVWTSPVQSDIEDSLRILKKYAMSLKFFEGLGEKSDLSGKECNEAGVMPCLQRLQTTIQQVQANPTMEGAKRLCRDMYALLDCIRDNGCSNQMSQAMNMRPQIDAQCRGIYPAL